MPSFDLEDSYSGTICGIDEVGRGPLCGPVVAAAVIIPNHLRDNPILSQIDDSKKMTAKRRKLVADFITENCEWGIGQASVEEIDKINILQASFLAMRRAYNNLIQDILVDVALVDGRTSPNLSCSTVAIIKGDSLSLSIAAASVLAKETRDKIMVDLAVQNPGFDCWARNAGYPTAEHIKALEEHGVTKHHRTSYAPVKKIIERDLKQA